MTARVDERGTVALLTALVGVLFCILGVFVLAVAVTVATAGARASQAADAAALAAVQASPLAGGSGAPSVEAAAAAAANGARLLECCDGPPPGWPLTAGVRVGVPVRLPVVGLTSEGITVQAAAALLPG